MILTVGQGIDLKGLLVVFDGFIGALHVVIAQSDVVINRAGIWVIWTVGFDEQFEKLLESSQNIIVIVLQCETKGANGVEQKKNVQKDEPTDKTEQESSAAAKTPSAVTITKDDITAVIVAKIKKKRDNNEKIGRLLKTYGVAQLSDLPAEKYEAFLADVSQI